MRTIVGSAAFASPAGAGFRWLALALTITASLVLGAGALRAQDFSFGPSLLRGGGRTVPGARGTFEYRSSRSASVGCYPSESVLGADVDVPLAWDANMNPESLRAGAGVAWEVSLFCPPEVPANPLPGVDYGGWDYGFVGFELVVGAEAPQSLDFTDLSVGAAVAYEHTQYQSLWFLPSASVALEAVGCVSCGLAAGGDETAHARLDAHLGWSVPFDRQLVPVPLRPIWLRLRGRGFWTFDLPAGLAAVRMEDGYSGSMEVGYRLDRTDWLYEVYIRWSGGELPVLAAPQRAWIAGVTVML